MRSKQSELGNNWIIIFDTQVIWEKLILKAMADKDSNGKYTGYISCYAESDFLIPETDWDNVFNK